MQDESRTKLWTTVCLSPRYGLIFFRGLFKWKEKNTFNVNSFISRPSILFSFCMNHWWLCCRLSVLWCPPCWLARAATRTGLSLLLPPKTQSKIGSGNQQKRVLWVMVFFMAQNSCLLRKFSFKRQKIWRPTCVISSGCRAAVREDQWEARYGKEEDQWRERVCSRLLFGSFHDHADFVSNWFCNLLSPSIGDIWKKSFNLIKVTDTHNTSENFLYCSTIFKVVLGAKDRVGTGL